MTRLTPQQRAQLYDVENVWAPDDDFFLAQVNAQPASRVLDIGCGTGRLAIAAAGHRVVGIDPDAASLTAARAKPGAAAVTFIDGTSAQIPTDGPFDTALMTAHVAQAIFEADAWLQTLSDIAAALRPGGLLTFDSRDPAARGWERWTAELTRGDFTLPDGTTGESWIDHTREANGLVTFDELVLVPGGTPEVQSSVLAFRSETQLRADLAATGFTVEAIHGGWNGEPVGAGAGELIVVARRNPVDLNAASSYTRVH